MTVRSGVRFASFFLLILLVLSIVLIVALMYADPSQFRGQIEALAEKRGVDLELNGDLRWEIFPSFRLRAESASVNYEGQSSLTTANIDAFSISLKPFSALRGELVILGAEVLGAEISNTRYGEGQKPDTNLDSADQIPADPDSILSGGVIENFRLSDVDIQIVDQSQATKRISIERLVAENITFDGGYFPIVAEFSVSTESNSVSAVETSGSASIDYSSQAYAVDFEQFSLTTATGLSELAARGFGSAHLNLAKNQWRAETVLSSDNTMGLTGRFAGSMHPFSAEGEIDANVSDVPKVMMQLGSEFGDAESLPNYLALDADITFADKRLATDGFRLRVDQISARGEAEYSFGDQTSFHADISIPMLTLDDYLGRSNSGDSANQRNRVVQSRNNSSDSSGLAKTLRSLSDLQDVNIGVDIETLTLFESDVEDVSLAMTAGGGKLELELERASLADGEIGAVAMADFLNGTGFQKIAAVAVGLDLAKMGSNASNEKGLAGTLQFQYQGSLDDLAREVLAEGLSGGGSVQVDGFAIQSVNIEQKLCEAVELVGASTSINPVWESGTFLGSLVTEYDVVSGVVELMDWDFEYGNMYVSGGGTVDLSLLDYQLEFSASVNGDLTSERGCSVNKYLQGVELPMLCSGEFASEDEMNCGLDTEVMQRLAVQQLRKEAVGSVVERLIQEDDLGSDDTETGGSDSSESSSRRKEVESLLQGLLNKLEE